MMTDDLEPAVFSRVKRFTTLILVIGLSIMARASVSGAPGSAEVLVFATASSDAANYLPRPDRPIYYLAIGGGFKALGQPRDDTSKSVGGDHVWRFLERAMRSQGYLSVLPPKKEAPPPALLVVFHWGTAVPSFIDDSRMFAAAADASGGTKSPWDIEVENSSSQDFGRLENWKAIGDLIGAQAVSPVDPEYTSLLVPATKTDRYFVLVSAYDFALANSQAKKKKLIWRVRMSVPAPGVNLAEYVGPMLASGANFFGRNGGLPTAVAWDKAQVKVGETVIVDEAPEAK